MPVSAQTTQILIDLGNGDRSAANRLMPLVYDELRGLAARYMQREAPGHTLQTTALVHEAYLRLIGNGDVKWNGRGHFFGAAAQAMRRILVDRARARGAAKRGGGRRRVDLEHLDLADDEETDANVLALEEALTRLERRDDRKARIVMLRYYAGLTIEQTARALGLSPTSVKNEWSFARAWLYDAMTQDA